MPWSRLHGHSGAGITAGLLHTAIFHAISPMYRHDPAYRQFGRNSGRAGLLWRGVLISQSFYFYTTAASVWIALIPAFFAAGLCAADAVPAPYEVSAGPSASALLVNPEPGTVLFSLVCFFNSAMNGLSPDGSRCSEPTPGDESGELCTDSGCTLDGFAGGARSGAMDSAARATYARLLVLMTCWWLCSHA